VAASALATVQADPGEFIIEDCKNDH
jgi:hypothetical protein